MSTAPAADMTGPVLIIAQSARALAQAARQAGCVADTIDMFADVDTRQAARHAYLAGAGVDYEFDDEILPRVERCLNDETGYKAIVAGSGFERRPDLLGALATMAPLAGASSEAVARLFVVPDAFQELSAYNDLVVPPTRFQRPAADGQWLLKRCGGSGGAHVQFATREATADEYYQRFVAGPVVSGVFLTDGERCECAGLHQHLRWQKSPAGDFRYQGAMTWPGAEPKLFEACNDAARIVAQHFSLRGLFGLDFVEIGAGRVSLIDINPRPPATLELLSDNAALFSKHLAACSSSPLLYSRPTSPLYRGHTLVYAEQTWRVPNDFAWPDGVADRPVAGGLLTAGEPLCSLQAAAEHPLKVITQLEQLAIELRTRIGRDAPQLITPDPSIRTVGAADDVDFSTRSNL